MWYRRFILLNHANTSFPLNMNKKLSDIDLKELGAQLRHPNGNTGLELGKYMAVNNANMIRESLDAMAVQNVESVLEIGFGSGAHVSDILKRGDYIKYHGIDISSWMVDEARKNNKHWVDAGRALFQQSDGQSIAFEDKSFNVVLSVNTLYFWDQPRQYLDEMWRVLKPGGRLILAFAEKSFLEKVDAQQIGFKIYDTAEIEELKQKAGFVNVSKRQISEHVDGKLGKNMERQFVVTKAFRP